MYAAAADAPLAASRRPDSVAPVPDAEVAGRGSPPFQAELDVSSVSGSPIPRAAEGAGLKRVHARFPNTRGTSRFRRHSGRLPRCSTAVTSICLQQSGHGGVLTMAVTVRRAGAGDGFPACTPPAQSTLSIPVGRQAIDGQATNGPVSLSGHVPPDPVTGGAAAPLQPMLCQ